MPTTVTAKIIFDDKGAQIGRDGEWFVLRDTAGNEVTMSLQAVLRCLSIAEHEKVIPELPDEFWMNVARAD